MQNRDCVEFYDGQRCLVRVDSSIVPLIASLISIRGVTWVVAKITYAVDYADNSREKAMRVCVDLKRTK